MASAREAREEPEGDLEDLEHDPDDDRRGLDEHLPKMAEREKARWSGAR